MLIRGVNGPRWKAQLRHGLVLCGAHHIELLEPLDDLGVVVRKVALGEVEVHIDRPFPRFFGGQRVTHGVNGSGWGLSWRPGRPPAGALQLGCLVSVGDEDRTAFADEAMASCGCRACYRPGNCAQRSAQGDRVTGDV